MTLSQLECFVEAAETGNFSAAAASLFRTQQNVSRQIHLLEEELGSALFERKPHGVVLTEAGKLLYEVEKEVLHKHRTIVDQIKDMQSPDDSNLRIGIGHLNSNVQQKITELLTEFCITYPGLEVNFNTYSASELLKNLEAEKIDFAITYTSELEKSHGIKIRTLEYEVGIPGIVLSSQHPLLKKTKLSLKDFSGETFGVLGQEISLDHRERVIKSLKKAGLAEKTTIREYSTRNNLQVALVNGKCVTIAFRDLIERFGDRLHFIPEKENTDDTRICLAWKKERLSTKAKNLAEFFNKAQQ